MRPELKIYLTYGDKGSGKSLSQARDVLKLFKEYAKTEKHFPELPHRIYFGNQKLSPEIEKVELGNHLYYWSNASQLRYCPRENCWRGRDNHPIHDTDIGHDEIGKDLPAGSWTDTPKWFRQVFSHLRKRGNRYFANTQVYEDIDIAFRRQIDHAYHVKKIFGSGDITATYPAPKRVWGLIVKHEFDPKFLEWERNPLDREEEMDRGIGRFILIRKKYVNAYDTTHEIPPYKPDTLQHREIWCEDDNCPKHGRKRGIPKLEHTLI